MKKYTETIDFKGHKITVSFVGSDEVGIKNPINTNVTLVCEKNNKVKWVSNFGNSQMPDGAWLGFNIIQSFNEKLFLGLGSQLTEIDFENGEILRFMSFGNTVIRQILSDRKNLFVRYEYYGFDFDKYESNILALKDLSKLLWYAELPDKNDCYANPMVDCNNTIQVSTFNCWLCTINKKNGKLIRKQFTK